MDRLEPIVRQLGDDTATCNLIAWPDEVQEGLDHPGFYAWWIDTAGADLITDRLGESVVSGLLYLGQAGGNRGRASSATLRSRLGSNHIGGKIRNSTLRLSIAALLLEDLEGHIAGDRQIGSEGEQMVSKWMRAHLRLTYAPFLNRERICELEAQLLGKLNPMFNLEGMHRSPLRAALRRRRSILRQGQPSKIASMLKPTPRVHRAQLNKFANVTLHDEISDILSAGGNRWMKTDEIAQSVNSRGNYKKQDLSPVTAYQIHGRARKYSHMFERKGPQVRLLR